MVGKNIKYDISLINDLSLIDASIKLNLNAPQELNQIKELFQKETELVGILTNPEIKQKEKDDLIDNIFKNNISDEMVALIKKIFIKYSNIVTVTATTAVPMKKDTQDKLKDIISKKLSKDVIFENEIDESIIGGVLLRAGDKVFDGTIKSELKSVEKQLKYVQI
jgi:F-type H+-transporting ATPase subunit delta